MRTFATETIDAIHGKQTFEKLIIDGVCQFDVFERELKTNGTYHTELRTIMAYMDFIANGKSLPKTKFREIKGGKNIPKLYEFKSKHLRIYAFHQPFGKIVVFGGYKSTQGNDIATLNSVVKEYIDSKPKKSKNDSGRISSI